MRRVIQLITLIFKICIISSCAIIPETDLVITGQVIDGQDGTPKNGALISIRASQNQTTSDPDGIFQLRVPDSDVELEVTAWSFGYYIASLHITPPSEGLTLELHPLYDQES